MAIRLSDHDVSFDDQTCGQWERLTIMHAMLSDVSA